ncbi:TatD family [Penicillium cf. griseofulvum]|uniref:TatD family n=1 Tax=Penicillium cf. griseofulvum TaxID=2972120 RepID=A0A9W9MT11_9EURO|nr:TatD family [Penicillium cf. griseofulvum]KAJ5446443.1 TatD family [Penicillium cf. griseofulvum]
MREDEPFPWDIGVYDAHCHPTDTLASVADIPQMKARTLTIMATRGEDQDLVQQTAISLSAKTSHSTDRVVPCFGWHPWFSHQILDDTAQSTAQNPTEHKSAHYTAVLAPSPADDKQFIDLLPVPKPLSELISETRTRLEQFPNALVGEVGLDRSFRLPTPWTATEIDNRDDQLTPGSREGRCLSNYRVKPEHQRTVLKAQLQLAGEMNRAVSLHSVQAHGGVFEVLKELWAGHERIVLSRRKRDKQRDAEGAVSDEDDEDKTPDGSQSTKTSDLGGNLEPIRQFLHRSNPSDVYFSFSKPINFSGSAEKKVSDVIKALPEDRILIESDLHVAGAQMDESLEAVARQVCQLRGWELRHGVQVLADNWRRFVFG